jgi:alkylated DNA repair dioxygenase AlkB
MQGLTYIKDFITEKEESDLIEFINSMEWSTVLERRTQHYGYIYSYTNMNSIMKTNPIPQQFTFIINALSEKFNRSFDQLIINEYIVGQGISPHIDNVKLFEDTIISISLGSNCIMKFTNKDNTIDQLLERRSLIALQEDARYKWKHSIPARKSDNNNLRGTRISLTFRKIKNN